MKAPPNQPDDHREHRIRSFVRREGRLTPGQRKALDDGLAQFGVPDSTGPIEFSTLFGRDAPTTCEIGFGNGVSLHQLAQNNSHINYLGIEVYRPGVGNVLRQIMDDGLANVRISTNDAVELLSERFLPASLDACLIFFPDPWPKKRHHKRRLIQSPFLDLIGRCLKPQGLLHIATDWAPYAEHIVEVTARHSLFTNTSANGDFVDRPESRPLTKFEERGQKLGHEIFDIVLTRS